MAGSTQNILFVMPLIEQPPSGSDRDTYYSSIKNSTTLQVTAASNEGLKISLSNQNYSKLYAIAGGTAAFIPAGNVLPTKGAEPSPGSGTLIIQTGILEMSELKKTLPQGIPPMTSILYMNIKPDSVVTALEPHVRLLPKSILESQWTESRSPVNDELITNYLQAIMATKAAVFVPGGAEIGKMELSDPSNTASDVEATIRLTDGAWDDLSPMHHLRSMPAYGGEQWTNHPLIAAVSNLPSALDIFLQFEVWNETTHAYETLPAGMDVDLKDYDPESVDETLATQKTDAQGRVEFHIADIRTLEESEPDLYFLVKTNSISHAGHDLPGEWSTKGWTSVDGLPGYYDTFKGTQLGDSLHPLIFRIGLDMHLRLTYQDDSNGSRNLTKGTISVTEGTTTVQGSGTSWSNLINDRTLKVGGDNDFYRIEQTNPPAFNQLTINRPYKGATRSGQSFSVYPPAPKGIPIDIFGEGAFTKKRLKTEESGEIHTVLFDVTPGETLYFRVSFMLEDSSIKLQSSDVSRGEIIWESYTVDADTKYFPNNNKLSLGSYENPEVLLCSEKLRNVALYFLKLLKELSTWLYYISGGGRSLLPGLTFWPIDPPASIPGLNMIRSFSIPGVTGGNVFIHSDDYWDRSTIIHEISHQIMWNESKITVFDLGVKFAQGYPDGYMQNHNTDVLTNEYTALLEGWAAFVELLFSGSGPYPFLRNSLGNNCLLNSSLEVVNREAGSTRVQLCTPDNVGSKVEGALANGLWEIFNAFVQKNSSHIPETTSGNETTIAALVRNDPTIVTLFTDIIWQPLQDLNGDPIKTSSGLLSHIRSRNGTQWHKIAAHLNAYNMAIDPPTITAISPARGPVSGGQSVTITGTNFVIGAQVKIGGISPSNIVVVDSTTVIATTASHAAGVCDVEVKTAAAAAGVLTGAYTYA